MTHDTSTRTSPPAHVLRKNTAPRKPKTAASAGAGYQAGHFLSVMEAGFPPRFESQIVIDPSTRRFISDYALAQRTRANSGFDRVPLGLPGAAKYREQA